MAISSSVNGVQSSSSNGGLLSTLATPDNISGMRMAVPVISAVQGMKSVTDAYAASDAARAAYGSMEAGYAGAGGAAEGIGGAVSSVSHGLFGALGNVLHSLPSLLKSNFVVAGLMSVFTNAIDFVQGKENGTQFLVDTGCDTVAYTGIGTAATAIGGLVGSIVPGIGTIIGMGVGALVGFLGGKLYETYLRPSFTSMMQAKVAGMGSSTSNSSSSSGSSSSSSSSYPTNYSGSNPSAPYLAPAS